jgi:hypothetical protein
VERFTIFMSPILIDILPCGGGSGGIGVQTDGQPTGTAVSQISDGVRVPCFQ